MKKIISMFILVLVLSSCLSFNPKGLMLESMDNNTAAMIEIIDSGVDVNFQDSDGFTSLMMASAKGNREAVQLLLRRGADTSLTDYNGSTALHYVCSNSGDIEIISLLLENGAEIDKQNMDGVTALMSASRVGFLDVVTLLCENGADYTLTDYRDETGENKWDAKKYAKENGRDEIVKYFESL